MTSDENGTVIGSTTVTARVEMPEDESPEETGGKSDAISTGDESHMQLFIPMMCISGIMIVVIATIKKR